MNKFSKIAIRAICTAIGLGIGYVLSADTDGEVYYDNEHNYDDYDYDDYDYDDYDYDDYDYSYDYGDYDF